MIILQFDLLSMHIWIFPVVHQFLLNSLFCGSCSLNALFSKYGPVSICQGTTECNLLSVCSQGLYPKIQFFFAKDSLKFIATCMSMYLLYIYQIQNNIKMHDFFQLGRKIYNSNFSSFKSVQLIYQFLFIYYFKHSSLKWLVVISVFFFFSSQ